MFSSSQDRNHPISFALKLFSFCAVLKMVPSTYILFSSQTWIVISWTCNHCFNLISTLASWHIRYVGEGATLASTNITWWHEHLPPHNRRLENRKESKLQPTSNLNACFHQKMIYFCHNKIVVGSTSDDNIFKFINPPENTFISACKWQGR